MSPYFAYNYQGPAFVQWGGPHLAALFVLGGIMLVCWRIHPAASRRQVIRLSLAGLLFGNELGWHAWHAFYGLWTVKALLPLNLCNLMVFLAVWVLLTRDQTGYEFLYLLGIPAASQVLLTPALGPYGFPHVLFFQILISHGGIVLAALYLTRVEQMRPRSWRAVGRVILWTTVYASLIFFLNRFLSSNYLFLAHKPPEATLLDYLGPWPWYILSMELIGVVLVTGLYLPFYLADRQAG